MQMFLTFRAALILAYFLSSSFYNGLNNSTAKRSHLRFSTLAVFGDSYTDIGKPSNNGMSSLSLAVKLFNNPFQVPSGQP